MSWFEFWCELFRPAGEKRSAMSSGAVREELMFHFRELVNKKLADGASFDEAWDQAEQQFGSMGKYENECRVIPWRRRLVWGIAGSAVVVLLLVHITWSQFEAVRLRLNDDLRFVKEDLTALRFEQNHFVAETIRERNKFALRDQTKVSDDAELSHLIGQLRDDLTAVRHEQSQLSNQTVQMVVEQLRPSESDLVGLVLDVKKQPLPDATVLVVLKTWPFGRYRQDDFTAKTDAEGKFLLPKLIPADGQYAIQVAALKDGFAFHSFYHLQEKPSEKSGLITLQLEPASRVTLVVRDDKGQPIPNVNVIPLAREAQNGDRYQIYFQGSEAIRQTTDAEGRVQFGCYLTGDSAEFCVQLPGQDWANRAFDISQEDIVVELAATSVIVN